MNLEDVMKSRYLKTISDPGSFPNKITRDIPTYYINLGFPMNTQTFRRYLLKSKDDIDAACLQLDATLKWRSSFGMMGLYNGSWKELLKIENASGKMYVRGYDRHGNALILIKPKYENTHHHDNNLKHVVYNLERAVHCMKKRGNKAEKFVILIDFDGFSLWNCPSFQTSLDTIQILQAHYPERLHKAYVVRPPLLFTTFFAALSPFISEKSKEKIVFLDEFENSNIGKILASDMDLNHVESAFGGKDFVPFNSQIYLQGSLSDDFSSLLVSDGRTSFNK